MRFMLLALQAGLSVCVAVAILLFWGSASAAPVAGLLFLASLLSAIACVAAVADRGGVASKT